MEYKKDMQLCFKNESEFIGNIDSPAKIIIKCDYETNGFCIYADSCDFIEILTEKTAKELNG